MEEVHILKIQYMSDLHLEFAALDIEQAGDVLVLAGDIISGSEKSRERFEEMLAKDCSEFEAVLMVIGNHEGYHTSYAEAREYLRGVEKNVSNFFLLDCDSIEVLGVTFHGCSLWSDPKNERTRYKAACGINDYRLVDGWSFTQHCLNHQVEVGWLEDIVKPGDVVITHFCPHSCAIDTARYPDDDLSAWYANNLTELIRELAPSVWISGHTHNTWEELIGDTLVVGNCRGYYNSYRGNEVVDFNPVACVIV